MQSPGELWAGGPWVSCGNWWVNLPSWHEPGAHSTTVLFIRCADLFNVFHLFPTYFWSHKHVAPRRIHHCYATRRDVCDECNVNVMCASLENTADIVLKAMSLTLTLSCQPYSDSGMLCKSIHRPGIMPAILVLCKEAKAGMLRECLYGNIPGALFGIVASSRKTK